VAEEEKSMGQLMKLAISVYHNGTLLKGKKRIKDTMTSSQLSGSAPSDWGLHPKLAMIVDRRGTSAENA
jgi:hypothetical protein